MKYSFLQYTWTLTSFINLSPFASYFILLSPFCLASANNQATYFQNWFRMPDYDTHQFLSCSHTSTIVLCKQEPLHWLMSLPSLAPSKSSALLICPSNSVPCFWALPSQLWLQNKEATSVSRHYQVLKRKHSEVTAQQRKRTMFSCGKHMWGAINMLLYIPFNLVSQSLIQVFHTDEMQSISLHYQVKL